MTELTKEQVEIRKKMLTRFYRWGEGTLAIVREEFENSLETDLKNGKNIYDTETDFTAYIISTLKKIISRELRKDEIT